MSFYPGFKQCLQFLSYHVSSPLPLYQLHLQILDPCLVSEAVAKCCWDSCLAVDRACATAFPLTPELVLEASSSYPGNCIETIPKQTPQLSVGVRWECSSRDILDSNLERGSTPETPTTICVGWVFVAVVCFFEHLVFFVWADRGVVYMCHSKTRYTRTVF